jgi:uncharacterized membrane protein YkvA (DUF1232 family)
MADTAKIQEYQEHYSEDALFTKVGRFFGIISSSLLNKVFTLWYTLRDKDTPAWAKTVILGALGYFIVPVDAIPDLLPIFGFSDDITALISASSVVWAHIKPEHSEKAKEKIQLIFKK